MQEGRCDVFGPLHLLPECEGSLSSSLRQQLCNGAQAVKLQQEAADTILNLFRTVSSENISWRTNDVNESGLMEEHFQLVE